MNFVLKMLQSLAPYPFLPPGQKSTVSRASLNLMFMVKVGSTKHINPEPTAVRQKKRKIKKYAIKTDG